MKVQIFTSNMESMRKDLCRCLQVAESIVTGKAKKTATDNITKAIDGAGRMLGIAHTAMGYDPNPAKYDAESRLYRGPLSISADKKVAKPLINGFNNSRKGAN